MRLAVLGGAFDPPHIGHAIVAQDVIELLRLDKLLVVPSARPPHRSVVLEAEDRLSLAVKAFSGDPRIQVTDVELRRAGPSFTIDTLLWVRETLAPESLTCVIGADQYRVFGTWHRPGAIVEVADLAVLDRPGDQPLQPDPKYPFELLKVTRVDLSSSEVRRRLDEGRSIRYLVPEAILEDVSALWRKQTTT